MSKRQSRREFMGLAAASAAGILTRPRFPGRRASRSTRRRPSLSRQIRILLVVNAKVYTVDTPCRRPTRSR